MSDKYVRDGLSTGYFDFTPDAPATSDYTTSITSHKALKDPRFLQDLREYYGETGSLGLTDEALIDKFYTDKTWADWNTVSAIKDAGAAYGMSEERRARAKRIENVWRNLPMAWQEGGRGVSEALGDVLPAVNIIPGAAAGKAGVTAGRAAYLAGKSRPMLRGAGRGAAVGGASEAAISGGQAAVHDTALQARDVQLGLQDEIDTGRLLTTTAVGTVAGSTVGGLIGAGAGALGARRGVAQAENALRLGLTPEQVSAMSAREIAEFTRNTQDTAGLLPQADEAVETAAEEAAPDFRTVLQREIDGLSGRLDEAYEAEFGSLANLKADGASAEDIAEAAANLERISTFRKLAARLQNAEAEVDDLLASNKPADQAEGQKRSAALHEALTDLRAAARGGDIDLARLNQQVQDASGGVIVPEPPAARAAEGEAEAPRQEAEAEPAPRQEGEAEAEVAGEPAPRQDAVEEPTADTDVGEPEAAASPTSDPASVTFSRSKVEEDTKRILNANGMTMDDLQGHIANGRIQLGARGKFTVQSKRQLETVIKVDRDSKAFVAEMSPANENVGDTSVSPEATETPAPPAPVVSQRIRQIAIEAGVDWREITGSGKDGKILRRDIKEAIPNAPFYRGNVMMDVDRVKKDADHIAAQANGLPHDYYRRLIRMLGEDKEIPSDVDDIVAMYDYTYPRSFDDIAADVRAGILSKDDAVSEIAMSGRQPVDANGVRIQKDEAKARLEKIEPSVEERIEIDFTQTEKKLIRKIAKERVKDGESKVDAEAHAQIMVLNRRMQGKAEIGSGDLASSGRRAEQTKLIEGAGRNAQTGRIQGILRAGIPTSEGRTINTSGLQRGEQKFINEKNFEADAALARAIETHTIQPFIPSRPVRGVMTLEGKKDFAAGVELYADPKTKRIYDSRETALIVRGDLKPSNKLPDTTAAAAATREAESPAPRDVPSATSDIQMLVRAAIDDNDLGTIKRILRQTSTPEAKPLKVPEAETPEQPTVSRADPDTPIKLGDRVLILQKADDPTDVRLAGKTQRTSDPTVQSIIGKNQKPQNWIVRYALAEEAEGVRNAIDKRALWNSANTVDPDFDPSFTELGAFTRGDVQPGILRYVGDETGVGAPLSVTDFDALPLDLLPKDMMFSVRGSQLNLDDFLSLATRQAGRDFDVDDTVRSGGAGIRALAASLESTPFQLYRVHHEEIGDLLAGIYRIERELSPGGIVRNNASRAESIKSLEDIFSNRAADEVSTLTKIFRNLGGDPERGPVLREGQGWSYQSIVASDGRRAALDNTIEVGGNDKYPDSFPLMHELGHWAYRNILTPEDRAEFWTAIGQSYAYKAQGVRRLPEAPPGVVNQHSPQEYFANQFATWVMRNQSDGIWEDPGFWQRISRYIEAVYNWVVKKEVINPDLMPLFSKILPEEERAVFRLGVEEPTTPLQHAVVKHHTELQLAKESVEEALKRGNPDGIIAAFANVQTTLARAAPGRAIPGQATNAGATFSVYRPLEKLIRDRFGDINQVLSGKANPYENSPGALQDTNVSLGDMLPEARINKSYAEMSGVSDYNPEAVADTLAELWEDGHAGGFTPLVRTVTPTDESVFSGNTSISKLFEMMERDLEAAFASEGASMNVVPASLKKEKAGTPSASGKTAVKREKTSTEATAERAVEEAKTPKQKRKRSAKGETADSAFAGEVRSASRAELIDIYRREAGTERGDQIAEIILAKAKAEPLPAKRVKITRDIMKADLGRMKTMLAEAFDNADSKTIDQVLYEVQRRAHNRANKGIKSVQVKPLFREVHGAIAQELDDHVGVQTANGIPASARGQVRTMLGYLTHRDPEVEVAMRTMTYRMVNLLGKAQRGTVEDANFMNMGDMARLSGQDLAGAETGAFMDFRSPTFSHLRRDLRRMSVALNKGKSTPFDAMHEVSHMLVRSGVLPQRELDAIKEAYRGLDAADPLKKRINDTYRKKYEGRDYTDGEMEDVLSEEWFAENFTQYLAERVAKGDIAQAALTGNVNGVALRGTINRAIDRLVEYVSYVLNGLIGRNDIKQTFRRITLFGDMMENTARPPMAGRRLVVDPVNAASYARDRYMAAPTTKQSKIARYVENGVGYNAASDMPVTWYHATPNASKFDKTSSPNEVFAKSENGNYGPGQYLSINPSYTRSYGESPTATSLLRSIDEADLPLEVKNDLTVDALYVSGLRKEMSQLRREYSDLTNNPSDDEVSSFLNEQRLNEIKMQLDEMVNEEAAIKALFRKHNIASDPGVIPFYVRAVKPADFRTSAFYEPTDDFVRLLMNNLDENPTIGTREMTAFGEEVARGVDGRQLYQAYVRAHKANGAHSDAAAKEMASVSLQDKGYDSLRTTHYNSVDNADIPDLMPDGRPYGSEVQGHETVVLFDETQSKHIDADYFDEHDTRMFYREVEGGGSAINAEVVDGWSAGASSKDTNWDAITENLEIAGASQAEASAMHSVATGRPLNAQEEQAMRKNSPWFFLQEQSTRMKNLGMHWIGDWYKDHFPEISQRFAGTYMPIRNKLRNLPDADGRIRAWARASTASVGQKQPKSYERIVRALRHGHGSRQFEALSVQEREIWQDIRKAMDAERDKMIKTGMSIGYRKDYLQQVWSKEVIQKNRDEFLQDMGDYYKIERTSHGELANDADALTFAERIYDTLAGDDADGVMSPVHGSTRNPRFEEGDFSRMIELDKHPAALKKLEKYLESDLEFLLTKYFEGSTRRLVHTEKFGLNSHGVYDYMMAMDQGADGIVRLLSTNREYRKDVRYKGLDGYPEDGRIIDTTAMPFNGREAEAAMFVKDLIDVHARQGSGAARQKLDEVATLGANGEIAPTYSRRADAIIAALDDFKGQPAPLTTANYNFMDNAMRVSRRQPLTTGGGQMAYKTSRALRNINSVTLLSFTTLTSLPDLVLPIIRSGSFTAYRKGLARYASDPEYRQMMKNVGVAMENIIHDRMTYMYGAADGKTTHAFFNATMLTPWTDMMRQIAGATAVEAFIAMQKKSLKHWDETKPLAQQSRQYKTAYRFLKRYGLGDFAHGQRRGSETLGDPALLDGDLASDELRRGIIKFADESIYAPNPNDIPLWGQTPFGAMMFQLKSFPLMMTRLTGYTLKEARLGNIKPLAYMATLGPAVAAGALGIKDIIQMRGGDENREAALRKRNLLKTMGYDEKVHGNEDDFLGWYIESAMHMGAMGILADSLGAASMAVENGTYGQNRLASYIFGPSFGLAQSGITAIAGVKDAITGGDNSNAKERSAAREVLTRIPVVGGIRGAREGLVDKLIGEASRGGSSSGWGGSWGSSWN